MIVEENTQKIYVKFTFPIFSDDKTGYCIYRYDYTEPKSTTKFIMCRGFFLPTISGITYEMEGTYVTDKKHRQGFDVISYKEVLEPTKDCYIKYLSSNLFPGIGAKSAEVLYEKYGSEVITIIENEPEKLTFLRKMTLEKAKACSEYYKSHKTTHKIAEFLTPFGIPIKTAMNVSTVLNIKDVEEIRNHPYRLCNVSGISLDTVDRIAKHCNYPLDSQERLEAHAISVLKNAELNGHTCMEAKEYGKMLIQSLNTSAFNPKNITSHVINLIGKHIISCRKITKDGTTIQVIQRAVMAHIESVIAEKLITLLKPENKIAANSNTIEKYISEKCKANNIILDRLQYQAIKESILNTFYIITGGPGMGKTTTIRIIAQYLKENDERKLILIAPSGRAARRITESTGFNATTAHSYLRLRPGEFAINCNEEDMIENTTIIIDESSMVDTYLMYTLVNRLQPGCRLIIVGDHNQLPSVGPGAILRDLIQSNVIPYTKLEQVFRQSENSVIYTNSVAIVKGLHEIKEGDDFRLIKAADDEAAQKILINEYMKYTKGNIKNVSNVYCICPRRDEGYCNAKDMNTLLQSKINPAGSEKKELTIGKYTYRIGDPVMQLLNTEDASNGDIGIVTYIGENKKGNDCIIVEYPDGITAEYTQNEEDNITLAYAFTIHKAQGSENKIVLTYLSSSIGKRLLSRNLLNTGITRASELVEVIYTDKEAIYEAIDNDDSNRRITTLKERLQYNAGQFVPI